MSLCINNILQISNIETFSLIKKGKNRVFGIYKDRVTAEESAEKIKKSGLAAQLFVTTAI